jgi:hypothetical protein
MLIDQEERSISALNRKCRFIRRGRGAAVPLRLGAVGSFGDPAGYFLGFAERAAAGDIFGQLARMTRVPA